MCFILYQVCFYRTKLLRSKYVVGIYHRIYKIVFCKRLSLRTAVFISSWNASPLGEEWRFTRWQKSWLRKRLVRSWCYVDGSLRGRRRLILISFYKAHASSKFLRSPPPKTPRLLRRQARCPFLFSKKSLYSVLQWKPALRPLFFGHFFSAQGSKFKFEFGSTCATWCKFLGALPKF